MNSTGNTTDTSRLAARTILLLLAGPIVWGLHFGTIYFFQSMLCAPGVGALRLAGIDIIPILISAVTLVALGGLTLFAARALRLARRIHDLDPPEARFEKRLALFLIALSTIGIIWAGATWTLVPVCASVR